MGEGWNSNEDANEHFAEMLTTRLEAEFPGVDIEVVTHDGTGPTNAIEMDGEDCYAAGVVQGIAEQCFSDLCSDPPAALCD